MLMVSMIHPIVSLTIGLSLKSFSQFGSNFWAKKCKIKSAIWKRLMTFSINVYLALIGMIIYYLILLDLCLWKEHNYKNQSYDNCWCGDGKNDQDERCKSNDEDVQNKLIQFSIENFVLAFSLVSLACHIIHSLTIAIPSPIPMIDFILGSEKIKDEEGTQSIEMEPSPKNTPKLEIQVEDSKCKVGWSICFKVFCSIMSMMFVGFIIASPYINFSNEQCQASNQSNASITCQTKENLDCVFPFLYENQVSYGCSNTKHKDFSLDVKEGWCATDPDFKSFGICKENCPGGKFIILEFGFSKPHCFLSYSSLPN